MYSSGFIKSAAACPARETHDPRQEKVASSQLNAEHATLTFLLSSIYNRLYQRILKVEHSLGDGFYCMDAEYQPITEEMCLKIDCELHRLLNSSQEIEFVRVPRVEVVKFFKAHGFTDKLGLMKTWAEDTVRCIRCGDYIDYVLEPMSVDKSRLRIFELKQYKKGIVLRFPTVLSPTSIQEWIEPGTFYDMIKEGRTWAKLINCDTVEKLNGIIYRREVDELKWIAEGLHEQKLAKIAKDLVDGPETKRIVTIAGPSSSNKTTFAKRLAIQLMVNGFKSLIIGMDDYYRDSSEIPVGSDGLKDFECISAINIDLLSERVHKILKGEAVPDRKFDFRTGKGYDDEKKKLVLPPNSFLIIEGIHGLNPELLTTLGRDEVSPIYVSALTPVNLDFNHRFPTSDLRLIRRIIRDYRYRGYSPRQTIRQWTSVRIGEQRNIFPFQGNADHFFNSALIYELPVLSIYGKALLAEATIPGPGEDPEDPVSKEITQEAKRLSGLLNLFYPISVEVVPHISCIREFVGGSDLKY